MKNRYVLLCVFAVACASNTPAGGNTTSMPAAPADWSAALVAGNGSTVKGDLRIESSSAGYVANFALSGSAPGAEHLWHIHTGTCANGGPIVGTMSAYPVLKVGPDGKAAATAKVGATLTDGGAYIVNVHRSAADMSVLVCAPLKK